MIASGAATINAPWSAIPKKDLGLFKRTGETAGAETPIAETLAKLLG